jgi:hypothetical protein
MRGKQTVLALAVLVLATSALAYRPARLPAPVYVEGSHYTAILEQRQQKVRISALDGAKLEIWTNGICPPAPAIPTGVWYVSRNAAGQPELLAPSTTALPEGYPERVALVACGTASEGTPAVALPQAVIDMLATSTGAVYVGE